MTKSFYIISSAVTSLIVLFLIGQWIGRSYSLTKEQLARQLHESFCHATEQYETDKTKSLPALFREELDKRHLDKLAFRIDTVSLGQPCCGTTGEYPLFHRLQPPVQRTAHFCFPGQ